MIVKTVYVRFQGSDFGSGKADMGRFPPDHFAD
jgi:hypothetical protein